MKLAYEDKLEIYRLWKEEGYGKKRIAHQFSINSAMASYIYHLIDIHALKL